MGIKKYYFNSTLDLKPVTKQSNKMTYIDDADFVPQPLALLRSREKKIFNVMSTTVVE